MDDNNDSVTEADSVQTDKTVRVSKPDGGVRPIRKKGFHRALKRREHWAVERKSFRDFMDYVSSGLMRELLNKAQFNELLFDPDGLIPFKIGTNHGPETPDKT